MDGYYETYDDDSTVFQQDYLPIHTHADTLVTESSVGDPYFDDFIDDIANSSPSPPERFIFHRGLGYSQEDDPIDQYEDDPHYHQAFANDTHSSSHSVRCYLPNISMPGQNRSFPFSSFPRPADVNPSRRMLNHLKNPQDSSIDDYENPIQQGIFRGSNPRNTHGVRLRPVSDLPDIYRALFKFGVFNAVQSTCFDDILVSDENLVISAPTGSGKTVLFELAIIKLLSQARDTGQQLKCVYMAPTKALCSERFRDWTSKFEPLGIKCCELTGDTVHFGTSAWGDAKNASIIITTGEKWDSLTRNWGDHGQILSQIQLFLLDEVHILNESRGSTLEVVISRMKKRGSAVRFLLVSATVPNIVDIAAWIGSLSGLEEPAKVFEFGEEFRPCKLTRRVVGFPRPKHQNDFMFAKILDYKLFDVLQQYSVGKPILVFCSTRKGVFGTAEQLIKDFADKEKERKKLPWSRPSRIDQSFQDKRLSELAWCGIGVHHAGLTMDDRRAVENLYLKKVLRVLVATSTLAVGVNLPAHMVVIKGVRTFQNNESIEYSDLDIIQMLGRAGRPQFDKDGIAVIMCELDLVNKYETLAQGKTILESSLHANLSEHINSEIGLRTINNLDSAKEWLRTSFLFQRIRKNPNYYALGKKENQTWQERIDDVVAQNVALLKETQLVREGDADGELKSTEYGDIMSKLYIRQSTMGLILALPEKATTREILEVISTSEELCDAKMRASEKNVYNNLRKHMDIRFEIKKAEKTSDKVFLLMQAVLGGISLNAPEYKSGDSQPYLEAFGIFRHAPRIARAVVEVAISKKLGAQVKHGLELLRCLNAKAWEDRPVVLRQIEHLGEKSLKVLAEHGITSLNALRKQSPLRLEALLNRRPPFGLEVLTSVAELPQYSLKIVEVEVISSAGKRPVIVQLAVECGLVEDQAVAPKFKKQKIRGVNMTAVLTVTSDLDLIDFRRIPTKALKETKTFEISTELSKPSQSITVIMTSETIAGLVIQQVYRPSISPHEYPIMNTRPLSSIEMDLAGLENDPDFWNMDAGDSDEEVPPVVLPVIRDLTRHKRAESKESVKPYKKQANVLESLDQSQPIPKKLQNGKYECNHPCKDKRKCRHFCCRDGLKDPPHLPKKRTITEDNSNVKQSSKPTSSTPQLVKPSAKISTQDRRLKNLESIHESAHVTEGLQLSKGQRLKLESPDDLKHKRRPKPDFRFQLTNLKDEVHSPAYRDIPEIDNEDELPEVHTILHEPRETSTPSSEVDSIHSGIDSLICALPLDEEITISGKETQATKDKRLEREKSTSPNSLIAPSNLSAKRRMRPNMSSPSPPPNKRVKRQDVAEVPNRERIKTKPASALFYSSSESELEELEPPKEIDHESGRTTGTQEKLMDDDSFSFDSDFIDILPATPPLTISPVLPANPQDGARSKPKMPTTYRKEEPQVILKESPVEQVDTDEFDELDAWLNNGSVEVV